MFPTKNSANICEAWKLSNSKENQLVNVPEETTNCLKENDVLAVEFLYKCFRDKMNGVILNEEQDMNMLLQVSAFFNAASKSETGKFLVLIVTPDESLIKWHYHLSVHADLKVKVVTANTCPPDVDEERLALLLQFSNIKVAENLLDLDYFSVVIDNFDTVATKLIVKKLYGIFNIGLSQRNFYTTPDQKLQWNMLNWSNPGCVGKLADFYEIDNDNFANFRNNYRHWWFRLTWSFCESLKKRSDAENQQYDRVLKEWAQNNNLFAEKEPPKESRKRKAVKNEEPDIDKTVKKEPNEPISTRSRRVYSSKNIKKRPKEIVYKGTNTEQKPQVPNNTTEPKTNITDPINTEPKSAKSLPLSTETTDQKISIFEHVNTEIKSKQTPKKSPKIQFEQRQTNSKITETKTDFTESDSSRSSEDTIIYENETSTDDINASNVHQSGVSTSKSSYVILPSMDETPIVTSIKRTLEKSPSAIITPCKKSAFHFDDKMDADSDILLSIIKSSPLKQNETVEGRRQTDVVAMETDEPEEFFQSLLAKNEPTKSDSDSFLESFMSKSRQTGDFSRNYDGDDLFSTSKVVDLKETSDVEAGSDRPKSDSDGFFESLVSNSQQIGDFSPKYVGDDVFSTSNVVDLKEGSDVEADSDDFINTLVGGGSTKSSKRRSKVVRDVDVEQVLKCVDDVLNS